MRPQMSTLPHNPQHLQLASCLIAAMSAVSVAVLWGWWSGRLPLTSFYLGTATMKANAAAGFLLLALGLVGVARQQLHLTTACGLAVMALAVVTVAEYVLDLGSGLDQLLVDDPWSRADPGRMAVGTAVTFVLAGAMLAMHSTYPQQHTGRYDALVVGFLSVPLFVLFAYIFAPAEVIDTPLMGAIPLHSCINFLLFFFALALLTRGKGSAGLLNRNTPHARNFRVLFFMVLILPLSLGSVLNYGIAQQWIGAGISIAIFCLFSTLIIAAALAHHTLLLDHWLGQLQQEREHSSHLENQIRELLNASAEGIIMFDGSMQVLQANSEAERRLGYSADEFRQADVKHFFPGHSRAGSFRPAGQGTEGASQDLPERLSLRHKDGHEVPASITFTHVASNERTCIIAVIKAL